MEITAEELRKKIGNGENVIVDFWASWCGPCLMMKPRFENVAQKSRTQMYMVNVGEEQELALELGIRAVPTIKVFSNGSSIETHVGALSESALMEMAKKYENG
jgi:thioredoxin